MGNHVKALDAKKRATSGRLGLGRPKFKHSNSPWRTWGEQVLAGKLVRFGDQFASMALRRELISKAPSLRNRVAA